MPMQAAAKEMSRSPAAERSPAEAEQLRIRASELRECLRKDITDMDKDLQELRQKSSLPLALVGSISPDKLHAEPERLEEKVVQREGIKVECLAIVDATLANLLHAASLVNELIKEQNSVDTNCNSEGDLRGQASRVNTSSTEGDADQQGLEKELQVALDAKRQLERDLAKESERIWALLKELDVERQRCEHMQEAMEREKRNTNELHAVVQAYKTHSQALEETVHVLTTAKDALATELDAFLAGTPSKILDSHLRKEEEGMHIKTSAGMYTPPRKSSSSRRGSSKNVQDNNEWEKDRNVESGASKVHHASPGDGASRTGSGQDMYEHVDLDALLAQEREKTRILENELREQKERNSHLVQRAQIVTHDQFVKHTQLVNDCGIPADRSESDVSSMQRTLGDRRPSGRLGTIVDTNNDSTCTDTTAIYLLSNSEDAGEALGRSHRKQLNQDKNGSARLDCDRDADALDSDLNHTYSETGSRRLKEEANGSSLDQRHGYIQGNGPHDATQSGLGSSHNQKHTSAGATSGGVTPSRKLTQRASSMQSGHGDTTDVSGYSGDDASHVLPT
jgi:hypothetical protein